MKVYILIKEMQNVDSIGGFSDPIPYLPINTEPIGYLTLEKAKEKLYQLKQGNGSNWIIKTVKILG